MGFSKEELAAFRDATVDDLIGPSLRLLFVGINPGLWTAATQTHFCHPSNRFYPALHRAGLIDFAIDTNVGMTAEQKTQFIDRGMGITNLVQRATVRASELGRDELEKGGRRLTALMAEVRPEIVAIAGVTAYRTAFGDNKAQIGRQGSSASPEIWVLPNPSGLNAHVTVDDLADRFRRVGLRAGVL